MTVWREGPTMILIEFLVTMLGRMIAFGWFCLNFPMSYGLRMSPIQNWSNRLSLNQQRVWQWWKFIGVHHKPIIKQLGYLSTLTLTYPRLSSILASCLKHLELRLCCLPMRLWHTPWRRRRNVRKFWISILISSKTLPMNGYWFISCS